MEGTVLQLAPRNFEESYNVLYLEILAVTSRDFKACESFSTLHWPNSYTQLLFLSHFHLLLLNRNPATMVLAKSKNAVGLGNSLMNDRFGKGKSSNMHRGTTAAQDGQQIKRKDQAGNEYITPAKKEAEWMKMRSVTEQGALDEFLSTAELAGTDFTAEKMNHVKIIHTDQRNPYLLSREEERGVVRKQNAKRARLTVPRRPPWDERTTRAELDERERESLLQWRRGIAELQEVDDLLMTPFERNLEVWRQLWRVIERSDLVVQIVDARNPLLFRCDDLENYVKEVDQRKRNLLLVNKADMMTEMQRKAWAGYFVERGINFRFFSAELARELNEARYGSSEGSEEGDGEVDEDGNEDRDEGDDDAVNEDDIEEEIDTENDVLAKEGNQDQPPRRTRSQRTMDRRRDRALGCATRTRRCRTAPRRTNPHPHNRRPRSPLPQNTPLSSLPPPPQTQKTTHQPTKKQP